VKVPLHVVQARRERLAQLIEQHRYLPVQELCRRLGVSEATARRDLAALVREKKITRTYGGALHEFNDRFPSFRERRAKAGRGKAKIASNALAFIERNRTCFFDSGTTVFAIAEAFRERPVTPITIVTSNLPVGEMLAAIPGVEVYQLAGQLLHLQSTLLGETARRSLEFWTFDVAFLSAEGMNADGLWNSDAAIIEQQRAVLARSRRGVFCVDASKLNHKAPHFLLPWDRVDVLLTDATETKLRRAGIPRPLGEALLKSPVVNIERPLHGTRSHVSDSGEDDLPVHVL
jgi:DeoR/GlpR family transcriptional regulator of sugar metabolism